MKSVCLSYDFVPLIITTFVAVNKKINKGKLIMLQHQAYSIWLSMILRSLGKYAMQLVKKHSKIIGLNKARARGGGGGIAKVLPVTPVEVTSGFRI